MVYTVASDARRQRFRTYKAGVLESCVPSKIAPTVAVCVTKHG